MNRKTINPESKIKLTGMRLSGDENTKVIDDLNGINGDHKKAIY